MGKGEFFGFLMQGAEPGRRGGRGSVSCADGGLAPTLPDNPAVAVPNGWRRFWSPDLPAISKSFSPIPPPPSRREGGDFWFSYARGFAPCIPGTEPRRRGGRGSVSCADGGGRAERGRFVTGRGANAGLHQQFIRKSSWGFGGFFQEAPERFPAMVPGGKSLSRGKRERRTASAIHSGKVLGGLGASFKKPPTFFVSSFLRIFSVIPHLRSADSMT